MNRGSKGTVRLLDTLSQIEFVRLLSSLRQKNSVHTLGAIQ